MAVQSKYYQVTNQILLEYKTDQYVITRNSTGSNINYMMYEGIDGKQYCLLNDNIQSALYQKDDKFTQHYGGDNSSIEVANNTVEDPYGHNIYLENSEFQIGKLITDSDGNEEREDQIYCDTIRLYILTGYVMNNIGGYSVKVRGKVIKVSGENESGDNIVKRVDDYIYLLNWYMPKEELKNHIHWLENPLYLNSKFYDRYIEIKLPAAQDIAINKRNIDYVYRYIDENNEAYYLRGTIDRYSNIIVEFATVQQDNITLEDKSNSLGPSEFILDANKEMSIYPESNSNNIGVKLYEDVASHSIIYYPTFGDGNNIEPINLDIMGKIDTGEIPLINYSEYDSANENMDDFIEMYGSDYNKIPCKWIIINELSVTYIYDKIYHLDDSNTSYESYTDFFTNTIDYSFKTANDGAFYISKFVPYIKERLNANCKSIVVQYNCHLYNRMNNTDIVRSASMTIKNPYKYVLTQIDTSNIINYKIVNKIEKQQVNVTVGGQQALSPQIIREFYNVTELVVSDGTNNIYGQGQMTLKLNRSGSNYMIKLFQLNKDNTRTPYDLSGPYTYKMVFPGLNHNIISIFPSLDNINTNLINGSLSFYISGDKANQIMSIPASERYFAIIIDNNGAAENSTLYEGRAEWLA